MHFYSNFQLDARMCNVNVSSKLYIWSIPTLEWNKFWIAFSFLVAFFFHILNFGPKQECVVLEGKKDTIKVKSSKGRTYDLKTKQNKNLKGSSWTHLAAGFWERTRHPITPQSKCCKENVSVLRSHPLSFFFLKKGSLCLCYLAFFPLALSNSGQSR